MGNLIDCFWLVHMRNVIYKTYAISNQMFDGVILTNQTLNLQICRQPSEIDKERDIAYSMYSIQWVFCAQTL